MTEKPVPPEYRRPERLTKVSEGLFALAVRNVTPLVGNDSELAEEVVRRALAPLRLADPDLHRKPVYYYPDGSATDEPMLLASGYRCQWGTLRTTGEARMCQLSEPYPDGSPGPGHDTPGGHAFRDTYGEYVPFRDTDPAAFYVPTWSGEDSPEEQFTIDDMPDL